MTALNENHFPLSAFIAARIHNCFIVTGHTSYLVIEKIDFMTTLKMV